ncbi:MAG: DUF1501 domain-containing protein [Lentisphaeraceae bacterium]|nr:DUF1501 domain-containing protein [Lentisphaeraceae bacterium]
MDPIEFNRRQLLKSGSAFLTYAAMAGLHAEESKTNSNFQIPAKAKRVIYICHSGGQSQLDLFDHKPGLKKWHGKELPESIRKTQRQTTMTDTQSHFKVAASKYNFSPNSKTGIHFSDLLPNIKDISHEICLLKSMYTREINHDPAICNLMTGTAIPGKPSLGAWLNYGLGSLNNNFPSFIVMLSQVNLSNQTINSRLWDSGFLPDSNQGTRFFNSKSPVLFLENPKGFSKSDRQKQINFIKSLNAIQHEETNDRQILERTKNYELAFKMQSSIPEIADLSNEKEETFKLYGEDSRSPGTFAYNCLMARRLAEKDVRFIQLFHRGWDQHTYLETQLPNICKSTDLATAALITDLKQRGLLEDTLIVNSTEFGRTSYSQGKLDPKYGRDHHGGCFSAWLAGAGVKKGISIGETDEFSYNVAQKPISTQALNATILQLMGIDHKRFTFFHRGLTERLTGVEETKVVNEILS